jgi:hypothetical protein
MVNEKTKGTHIKVRCIKKFNDSKRLSMSYKNKNNKYDDDSPNPILWA